MIQLEIRRRGLGSDRRLGDYDVLLTIPDQDTPRTLAYGTYVQHFDRSRGTAELLREAVEAISKKLPR